MNATFDVTIEIDGKKVATNFGMKEGATNMDINLLSQILKVVTDTEKKIKTQVDKYYGIAQEIPAAEGQEQQED